MNNGKIKLNFKRVTNAQSEEMAADTLEKGGYPLPTPADAEAAKAQRWEMLNDSIVRRVTRHRPSAEQLTEVFNFTTRTCQQIYENPQQGPRMAAAISFDDVNKEWVKEAAAALRSLGGRTFGAG